MATLEPPIAGERVTELTANAKTSDATSSELASLKTQVKRLSAQLASKTAQAEAARRDAASAAQRADAAADAQQRVVDALRDLDRCRADLDRSRERTRVLAAANAGKTSGHSSYTASLFVSSAGRP
jgi:predicted  nucleic acid-binding Zn-ribbon protein